MREENCRMREQRILRGGREINGRVSKNSEGRSGACCGGEDGGRKGYVPKKADLDWRARSSGVGMFFNSLW